MAVPKLALIMLVGMVGCDSVLTPKVQHAGPFTVVTSVFDYHETLAYPDGREFEFNHDAYTDALTDEGSVVEIDFTGNLTSQHFNNHVISVKVIKHSPKYIKHHPELWPPRKGHWDSSSYILDDTNTICGTVEDYRSINDGWTAVVASEEARESVFKHFTTRTAAVKAVEKACS